MTREQHFKVDGIDVVLVRKRVKNVNLRVRGDGTVSMSAPAWVSDSEIERFVDSHSEWIRTQAEKTQARVAAASSRTWSAGDAVMLWGEPLTIALSSEPGRTRAGVRRQGSLLAIVVSPSLAGDDERAVEARHALIERWWKHELEQALPRVVARSEAIVGQHANEWRVRRMKTRWGSCSIQRKRIWLNAELASKPPMCLDYVAIHELCHLIEPSHDAHFHALMDQYAPGWRDVRKQLNGQPPTR